MGSRMWRSAPSSTGTANPCESDGRAQDAEGLALIAGETRNGTALVSFERDHRIMRYPFTPERFGPLERRGTPAESRAQHGRPIEGWRQSPRSGRGG